MPLTEANLIFNQELAAWVQAIGSVIAIFVAVAIPLYFDRKQHRDEQQVEENQKQKFLITLLPTLYQLRNSTQIFLEKFQNQHEMNPLVQAIRDVTDAALTKPFLIETLIEKGIGGRDFISALRDEKEHPLLLLGI